MDHEKIELTEETQVESIEMPEVVESSETQPQEERAPETPEEILSALTQSRMGQFDVKISHSDLKYIKNIISNKLEWTGPNEAYLTIISTLTIDNALAEIAERTKDANESVLIKIPAATIESIDFFLNKVSGKGLQAAQRLFSAVMQFRQAIGAIKKLDGEIATLQEEIKLQKSEKSTDK